MSVITRIETARLEMTMPQTATIRAEVQTLSRRSIAPSPVISGQPCASGDREVNCASPPGDRYLLLESLLAAMPCNWSESGESESKLEVIDGTRPGQQLNEQCQIAMSELPHGGRLAIVTDASGLSRFRKALRWLGLRRWCKRAESALLRAGARETVRYAVVPTLESPMLIYQMASAASEYAERNLNTGSRRSVTGALRVALGRMAGCDPSVTAVVVVGVKP